MFCVSVLAAEREETVTLCEKQIIQATQQHYSHLVQGEENPAMPACQRATRREAEHLTDATRGNNPTGLKRSST
ncbi:hypothetical protein CgunFtcFv8_018468 [Champsocephalus gunnari]|uniref:Uncharacterized protein n=1 Tax=Champsocephalus gunnari TaxID=52237 RepID=A0AAN8GUE2_CHAGU|nr:hypothetical protein CgunFtcFv8_018468 [Champsocephalus gunnari]